MNVLIFGAGGMAGHVIARRMQEKGFSVTGFARRSLPYCNIVTGDVRDEGTIKTILKKQNFDAVVNAVGILPGAINKNPGDGIWINSFFPHLLVKLTENTETRIVHLSTDCVFSGHENGLYKEADFCSADDYYGRSKALGELNDDRNLTFRTSIVGPDINENGVGLFNWFMKQRGEVKGFRQAIWTGVTTITLADAIEMALAQGLTGLYHLANNSLINKYELLNIFNGLRAESISVTPDDSFVVDKSLVNTRSDFRFSVPSYFEMVQEMGEWINKYKAYYPQYNMREFLDKAELWIN